MTMIAAADARTLDEIAASIRSHWAATEDDRFAIGRDLLDARARFPGNRAFGTWLLNENFPFSQRWGYTLRLAAENEPAVRQAITSQLVNGKAPNIETALAAVLREAREEVPETKTQDPKPLRKARAVPGFSRHITAWLHRSRPEDREYLRRLDHQIHAALRMNGIECQEGN